MITGFFILEQNYKVCMNETIYQFVTKAIAANTFDKATNLVMDIILAVNEDATLIRDAINYVNDEFMKAALNTDSSNQSELN